MQCKKCIQPICYSSMHNVRSSVQCRATCYLFNEHGKDLVLVCNALQSKTCIAYITLQRTTLDRLCNAMQHVIPFLNMVRSQLWCAMQCKAKRAQPIFYSSMHNVRSSVQCNATYLISLMNMGRSQFWCAMQCKSAYSKYYSSMHNVRSSLQCNATCYLFNEHGKELVLVCSAMQCKKCMVYISFFNAQLQIVCAMQCKMLSLQ